MFLLNVILTLVGGIFALNLLLVFVAVKLNANRMVMGTLRGFDQFMNLVVEDTVEVNGNEKTDIGMVVGSVIPLQSIVLAYIFR